MRMANPAANAPTNPWLRTLNEFDGAAFPLTAAAAEEEVEEDPDPVAGVEVVFAEVGEVVIGPED